MANDMSPKISPSSPSAPDRTTFRFVLFVWLLSSAFALWIAVGLGFRMPYADEWRWTGEITGRQSEGIVWFLKAENSHRLPLPKLIYIGLTKGTGDFRASAVASVVLLSAASLVLIFCIRRRRGSASTIDVVFPLLVLHGGNYLNLMWGLQIFYCLSTALALLWLSLVVVSGPRLSLRAALLGGGLLLLLGLCGGPGICLVPALALWVVYVAWHRRQEQDPQARRDALLTFAQVVPAGLLLIWYFSGSSSAVAEGERADVFSALRGAVQVAAISCGRIGRELWPASGIVVFGCLSIVSYLLVRNWRSQSERRVEIVGFACFIAAMLVQALAIGIARGGLAPDYCLTGRYTLLIAPLAAACAACIGLYPPRVSGPKLRWGVPAVSLFIAICYGSNGANHARELLLRTERVARLVHEGVAPSVIGERCSAEMQDPPTSLAQHLQWLEAAGLPPYPRRPVETSVEFISARKLSEVAAGPARKTVVDGRVRWEIPLRIPTDLRVTSITVRTKKSVRSRKRIDGFAWSLAAAGNESSGESLPDQVWSQDLDHGDPVFATLAVPTSNADSAEVMLLVLHASQPGVDFPVDGDQAGMIDAYFYFSAAPTMQANVKRALVK